ncbi:MAG: glycosyltransferase family 4 protein [Prevotella sp.]|nr:glycosyltransferase family 4 protein [Prevotella sp.]
MKIVYIIKSFAMKAGTERVMSDKMNWLAEHGYNITMVTYEQGDNPLAFSLHPSIRHIDLGTCFYRLGRKMLLKRVPAFIKMRKEFRSRLQAMIDEVGPDIIISTTYSMKVMDIILSARTKARQIVESHVACYTIKKSYDYRNNPVMRVIASVYDKWMVGRVAKAEQLVVLTNGDADDWRTYTPRVAVIPNPVTACPEEILPHDGSGHRILCVGRLEAQKGFDMLIEAFALIANQCKDWFVDIYGDGSDKAMLTDMIRRNNLAGRININAPVSNIYDEYQRSEFFVLSSRFEGLPLVLGEAMSCGIPCVSFNCKYGPEDLIDDTETGLLVDNGSVKELADKMLWMINHRDERLVMGQKARQAAARFDKDAIMQKWHDLFSQPTA